MADPLASEIYTEKLLCHPGMFMQCMTPVDRRATKILPFQHWHDEDHWGRVRLYQIPSMGWDHLLSEDAPIDAGGMEVDRVAAGSAFKFGGRNTSKSFDLPHDELQDDVIRPGEQSVVTSLDDNHLTKRLSEIWKYIKYHPFFMPLVRHARQAEPYATIDWWNGHETVGVYESTSGGGDNYLGTHAHRYNFDEFQLTGSTAWKKVFDARAEEGCVIRTTGVSDGRIDTPAHEIRNSPEYARFVHILPQYMNELVWRVPHKRRSIENYGGEDSQGYKENVRAEEGDPTSGVWDITRLWACTEVIPEDKKKTVDKRRYVKCPVTIVSGDQIRKGLSIDAIELPPDRVGEWSVWLAMDVGKRRHPSVIGVWGMDGDMVPHLWGMIILVNVNYDDQAPLLWRMILHYDASVLGIDATGGGGQAIVEHLQKLHNERPTLRVVPVVFSNTVEVPDVAEAQLQRKSKRNAPTRKLRVKYYSTQLLQRRFEQMQIKLLHDVGMFLEFQTEVAKVSTGRSQADPETYFAPSGDHRIDMMRVLVMMFFYIELLSHTKRKPKKMGSMVSISRWI